VTYFIAVLSTLTLLAGFVVLVQYEARKGMRFFAPERDRFDKHIERIEFIVAHVDFGAFVQEEIRHAANRIGHTTAHLSLQTVRAAERLLTRLVRHLRVRHDSVAPHESTREFVKTLSDFKGGLKATHPDVGVSEVE
jgi:Holliday junction resolvasome RuvABC ATP-dependent DNA helicase subunit